jgi:hypothetical protein
VARRIAELRGARRQRGAALILFAAVLILAVAWYAVSALGKAAPTTASREIATGLALQQAKRALLSYVAQHAARSDTASPGQLPCPESLALSSPGEASSSCSPSAVVVGRLPWKTLGVDQLRDGYGEPLWYMIRQFRDPPINFNSGAQLVHNGSTVVAMIIAPGVPLNTTGVAGSPPAGCSNVNQFSATRHAPSLVPANFVECGVTSGSIVYPGDSNWTNDRVLAITAAEWADTVAPAVADRLQRQVAPAMYDFYDSTSLASWGMRFFPNASTLDASVSGSQPESNNLCGNNNMRSGMPPTATVASGVCSTNWTGVTVSGLGSLLSFGGCTALASHWRCDFLMLLGGIASPRINISASRVGYSFRYVDTAQITIQVNGGATSSANVGNFGGSVSSSDGSGLFSFEVFFPLLSIADVVSIRIPYATDALLADSRSAWFVNNQWDRHTYYGVARAATHDPGADVCNPGGTTTNCLTALGGPAPQNDKRLVLALMGRQRAGTTVPSYDVANYLEYQNASVGVIYETRTQGPDFNDWIATCPFKHQNQAGADVVLCN